MNITKLGHCCLVLEINGTKMVTDPGSFTTAQDTLTGIDVVLITHEHGDHFHVDSVKALVKNNPTCTIVTNFAVATLIKKEGIEVVVVVINGGESAVVSSLTIEGFGHEHAPIYGDMGKVENTGYMVADTFYFPGDNFQVPGKPVEVLALPVAGPWMKISEAIDFSLQVKARIAFGVHDGMIVPNFRDFTGMVLQRFVPDTMYVSLADGATKDFS